MKHFQILSFLLCFALLASTMTAQGEQQAPQKTILENDAGDSLTILEASKDTIPDNEGEPSETEELGDVVGGIMSFWAFVQESYKEKNPKGAGEVLLWLLTLLGSAFGTVKMVQLTRARDWLKKYFYKTATENIVKGVTLLVSVAITLLTTGGELDINRLGSVSIFTLLLSDVVYQLLKKFKLIDKTPEAVA